MQARSFSFFFFCKMNQSTHLYQIATTKYTKQKNIYFKRYSDKIKCHDSTCTASKADDSLFSADIVLNNTCQHSHQLTM